MKKLMLVCMLLFLALAAMAAGVDIKEADNNGVFGDVVTVVPKGKQLTSIFAS